MQENQNEDNLAKGCPLTCEWELVIQTATMTMSAAATAATTTTMMMAILCLLVCDHFPVLSLLLADDENDDNDDIDEVQGMMTILTYNTNSDNDNEARDAHPRGTQCRLFIQRTLQCSI